MSSEIYELLRADNTIYANRTLAASIGLNEAIIFSALLGKEYYYRNMGQLDGEGMFYSTASDIEQKTTLTQRQQDRAINHLELLGLIYTRIKGMPAKKYFKINPDTTILLKFLRVKPENKSKVNDNNKNTGESNVDKMLNQGLTKPQTLFQHNAEPNIDEMLEHDLIETQNMVLQNNETIHLNNKYINNNKINDNARDEINNSFKIGDNFIHLINNFTGDERIRGALYEYIKMRLKRPKTATTEYTVKLALERLTELSSDPDTQIKILNQSILNSYPDLYELKKAGENSGYNGKPSSNRRTGGTDYTGLAGGENGGYSNLTGIVKLGQQG